MALNRKSATGVVKSEDDKYIWENLKKGDYECRLVYVADLGLQEKSYMGEFAGNFQQLALGVEVIGQGITDEDGNVLPRVLWTKPFYVYENGLTEKGTELKYYSLFDGGAVEGDIPDWEAQLDKVVSASVINVAGKGYNKDKIYDNIKGLDKIPEKYQGDVGKSISNTGVGDSEDKDNLVTKGLFGLPKFVWDKRIIEEAVTDVDKMEKKVDEAGGEVEAPY